MLEKVGVIKSLKTLVDDLKPTLSKLQTQNYSLSNSEKFSLNIGKRVLDSELKPQGKIPVYSANVLKPFGYIDKELLKDYESPSVLWGIDGDWLVSFMPANTPFIQAITAVY